MKTAKQLFCRVTAAPKHRQTGPLQVPQYSVTNADPQKQIFRSDCNNCDKTIWIRGQPNILRIYGSSFSILLRWQEIYVHNCEAKRAPRQIARIFPSTNTHSCQEWNILHCDILWVDVKIPLLPQSYFKILIIIEQTLNGQTSFSFACE